MPVSQERSTLIIFDGSIVIFFVSHLGKIEPPTGWSAYSPGGSIILYLPSFFLELHDLLRNIARPHLSPDNHALPLLIRNRKNKAPVCFFIFRGLYRHPRNVHRFFIAPQRWTINKNFFRFRKGGAVRNLEERAVLFSPYHKNSWLMTALIVDYGDHRATSN